MTQQDMTKDKYAEALLACMKVKGVADISVVDLTRESGLSRQTFYRHFKDKYDLINWYFDRILYLSFHEMGQGRTIYDGLVKKFYYIQSEHLFFSRAFRDDDQNSLKNHDYEMILAFYTNLISERTHRTLDYETQLTLEAYCNSSIFVTVRWVLGDIQGTPESIAKLLIVMMPTNLRKIFASTKML